MGNNLLSKINIKKVIFLIPFLLFCLYILTYMGFESELNISKTYIKSSEIAHGKTFDAVEESIYRAAWGISLIISNVINSCLIIYCLYYLIRFKSSLEYNNSIFMPLTLLGFGLWGFIYFTDLGGGISGVIHSLISSQNLEVGFKKVIDFTGANGYFSMYLVSLLLSYLCFASHNNDPQKINVYFRTYKTIFYLTSIFLSASIFQLFLQFQWFSVFLSDSPNIRLITFGFPLIMSVFYVGMFSTLFLSASEILRRIILNSPGTSEQKTLKTTGRNHLMDKLKSFILFMSPILTVVFAEAAKVLLTNNA